MAFLYGELFLAEEFSVESRNLSNTLTQARANTNPALL